MFNLEQREKFIKRKSDTDYTDVTKSVYNILKYKYSYSYQTRISDIFQLLKDSFGINEFVLLDFRTMNNAPFESWLVDRYISWMKDEEIDFIEIANSIYAVGEFTISEKELFKSGLIEERLWAIFLLLSSPELNI